MTLDPLDYEQQFISALVFAPDHQRIYWLGAVDTEWFVDPFHRWVVMHWQAIRGELPGQVMWTLAQMPAPDYIAFPLPYELARLLFRMDGTGRWGLWWNLPFYAHELKERHLECVAER